MQYIPQGYMPVARPSPLAGLGDAAKTLADAVIQGRERQALLSDYDLLPQILDKVSQLGQPQTGQGDETGDPYTQPAGPADMTTMLHDTLAQMKTPQGKAAAIKMMLEHGPKPLYGYDETGNLVQKGTMPKNAEILKADPMALEEKKQAGLERREAIRQGALDEREAKRQDWQLQLQTARDAAWEARDQRRYNQANDLMEKRLDFQERMKGVGTEKDRTSLARKEMLSLRTRAKENYNRQVGNIRKQFTDPMTGVVDEEKVKAGLAQAEQEYQQEVGMIGSAYGDVIEKYDIRLPGTAQAPGGGGQPRLYNNRTKQWENVDQATFDAVKKKQAGK